MRTLPVHQVITLPSASLWIAFPVGFDFGDSRCPDDVNDAFEVIGISQEEERFNVEYSADGRTYEVVVTAAHLIGVEEAGDGLSLFPLV